MNDNGKRRGEVCEQEKVDDNNKKDEDGRVCEQEVEEMDDEGKER